MTGKQTMHGIGPAILAAVIGIGSFIVLALWFLHGLVPRGNFID